MEQFLYGLFSDAKYHLLTSPDVRRFLSDQNFHLLRTREYGDGEPDWLPTEQVVAIQYITTISYDGGLTGAWNHTLIIPIAEYIRLTYADTMFRGFFMRCEDDISHIPLQPITIEE